MLEEGGGAEYHLPPPLKNLGGLGPLGLVFFTLENVLCLFESAIPGGKKHNIILYPHSRMNNWKS